MLEFGLLDSKIDGKMLHENEIMVKIGQKDEKALECLYGRYSKFLYHTIFPIVKSQDEAFDLLQELFLQVWKKASSFDALKGNCHKWLLTLAKNITIDRLRSRGFKNQRQELHNFDFNIFYDRLNYSQLDELILNERIELMHSALRKILPEEKEIIYLAYFEGYSQSEISEKLRIPLGTVKTRSRNGIHKLQKLMTDHT